MSGNLLKTLHLLLPVLLLPTTGLCLRLLELDVPTHKVVGESAKLSCKFEMGQDTLYSVKWYRNEQEFYRFVPNDRPKLQIFPQKGIKVERARSGKQHVFLSDLQIDATGTYRCEVSAEAPSFKTKYEDRLMVVVQPPKHNEIVGVRDRYFVGDTVNVTCYSRGSSPPASLTWKVNDVPVNHHAAAEHKVTDHGSMFKDYDMGSNTYYRSSLELAEPSKSHTVKKGRTTFGMVSQVQRKSRFPRYSQDDDLVGIGTFDVIPRQSVIVASIHDWFEKDANPSLDTAGSSLQFIVEDTHRHLGLRVECIASIGPVYWHQTQETCAVSVRERELPALFGAATRVNTGFGLLQLTVVSQLFLTCYFLHILKH